MCGRLAKKIKRKRERKRDFCSPPTDFSLFSRQLPLGRRFRKKKNSVVAAAADEERNKTIERRETLFLSTYYAIPRQPRVSERNVAAAAAATAAEQKQEEEAEDEVVNRCCFLDYSSQSSCKMQERSQQHLLRGTIVNRTKSCQ